MTQLATSQFNATTQTTVVFGRELTASENAAIQDSKSATISAGHQVSPKIVVDNTTQINLWSDLADAEAYVAVCGGFTPAPLSVSVTAV